MEELNFKGSKDYGNRVSNRKINNVWLRNYTNQLIEKHCKYYGIKIITVSPIYSSFIGNIIYDIYDPVASSIEILRRGMVKYIPEGKQFGTDFLKGVITEDMIHPYGKKVLEMDYNKLVDVNSWKSAYKLVTTTKNSVRRMDKNKYPFKCKRQNRTEKSKVKLYNFYNILSFS